MSVKLEIVILHPHEMAVEQVWERYTDLIGLLTIDAKAHFSVVDGSDVQMCEDRLSLADYVLPLEGCGADIGRCVLKAERLLGVLSCDEGLEARRFADAVLALGRDCCVVFGDKEQILKKINKEE